MRVHETRGFRAEVVTQGENGAFLLHGCCFIEGAWQDHKRENIPKADAYTILNLLLKLNYISFNT